MVIIPLPLRAFLRLLIVISTVAIASATRSELRESSPGHCLSVLLSGPLQTSATRGYCPHVIDDETLEGSWNPWTHPPTCIMSKKRRGPKLCTYTHSNFNSASGISILATPENAADAIDILKDVDPKWLRQGHSFAVEDDTLPSYTIAETDEKGLGAFANRFIAENEVIMTELPLLLRPTTLEDWDYGAVTKLLSNAGNLLPEQDRARIMSMARSRGGDFLNDVMGTNAYAITLGDQDHAGLFPNVARINHACKPNAFIRFSRDTLAMDVVAYRDIEEEEELFLSYVPLNLQFEDRQELLQRWGFECSCSLCSDSEASRISDQRRQRVEDIIRLLTKARKQDHKPVKELVTELFELCEVEGMLAQTGDIHTIIAGIWKRLGDVTEMRKHARLALDLLKHYAGSDSDRTDQAVQVLERLA